MRRPRSRPGVTLVLMVMATLLARAAWAQPYAYVSNEDGGSVSVIDLATETVVTTITTGGDPYWVNISRDGSLVAVSLHDSTGLALINGLTNTLIAVVGNVGREPEAVAVTSNGATVYIADEDPADNNGGDLYVIDVATRNVRGPIDLAPDSGPVCDEPETMVISPDNRFLYITCPGGSNNLVRVDTTANYAITEIDKATNDAHGLALTTDGTRLYYSNGTDAFEYDTGMGKLTDTKFEDCDMYGGAVSPDGTRLYCVEESSSVKIYDTSNGQLLQDVALGSSSARAVAVHPNNSRAYVPVSSADAVEVVDAVNQTNLDGNIPVGNGARGIAIGPGGARRPVPALGPWVLIALAGMLGGCGVWIARHRSGV